MDKMQTGTLIILIFVSISFTGIVFYFAFKRVKKLQSLPDELRKKEIEKDNNRESLGLFMKDIIELLLSIKK